MPKASRATAADDLGASHDAEEIETRLGEFDVCFARFAARDDILASIRELARSSEGG